MINYLQEKLQVRFPDEDLQVLLYTTIKQPATVKCKKCGQIYSLKSAENFIRAEKKCVCRNCINNKSGGRLDKNDFEAQIKNKYPKENLQVLDFKGRAKPCSIQCRNCKNIYSLDRAFSFTDANKKRVCKICFPNKRDQMEKTRKDLIQWFKRSEDFQLITPIDKTIKSHSLIQSRCLHCNKILKRFPYDYLNNHKCQCQVTNTLLTNEEYQLEIGEEYSLLSDYKGRESNVLIRHNVCGFCYKVNARHYTCPRCTGSKGEKKISFWLQQHNICFQTQVTQKIQNHNLRFDFFLPAFNTYIEYQGIQHEQPVPYFGGEKQFYKQQEYDNLKREWCKYHNHFLLEITYKEDVNESLSNYLSQFNDYPKEEYSISD